MLLFSEKTAKPEDVQASEAGGVFLCVPAGDASLFSGLTFPRFRPALGALSQAMLAVGAIRHGRPCGLAFGIVDEGGRAELLSLAVSVAERRRGIGLDLLRAFEAEACRRGASAFFARYNESLKGRAAFEALAAAAGWDGPEDDGLVVVGRAGAMAEAVSGWPAVSGRLAQPGLYALAPVELSVQDRQAVAHYMRQPVTADMQGPLAPPPRFSPDCSLLIRRRGALVGWVLAEETDECFPAGEGSQSPPGIRYGEAFLDPACWHSGIAISAYHHCYATQARLFGRNSMAVYYTNGTRPRMVALTRRRFAPLAERVEGLLTVTRRLAPLPNPEHRKEKA